MYSYVGPKNILTSINPQQKGYPITSVEDIQNWILISKQDIIHEDEITATFTIGEEYILRLADRRSEHVACAGGMPVVAAGEITFDMEDQKVISISHITNQSTGYCPAAACWKDIDEVLTKLDLDYPTYFTQAFVFRICPSCNTINIIKDSFFVCSMCETALSEKN